VVLTRRDLGKVALAALPASRLLAKPDSKFDGVQVGAITYSYRSMPGATDGAQNLEWGKGETPIKEILNVMRQEKYKFPASIELEYQIPEGSDAVAEVAKCVQFCKAAQA